MNVKPALFVETNFLVGHARGEHEAFDSLLAAAETGRIELVVPVFCFYEALKKLIRDHESREQWAKQLDEVGKELRRKKLNSARATALEEAAMHLRGLVDDHKAGFEQTTNRVRACATLVELGPRQLDAALEFEKYHGAGGDSWVGASLRQALLDATSRTRIFLTTDSTFANSVEAWTTATSVPSLLEPFAGLLVRKHPAAVVKDWQLSEFTPAI